MMTDSECLPDGDRRVKGHWLRLQFAAQAAALQFLTLSPPMMHRPFRPAELGAAVGYFPLVGLLIGLVLAGFRSLIGALWLANVVAAVTLAAWVIITGALHLDGFLDACDGLFGGHTVESRLSIMRDHRIGAFALAGGALLLLLKYTLLAAMPGSAAVLIVAATLGRWGLSFAVVAYPYARPEGLGRQLKDHAGPGQLVFATILSVAVVGAALGWQGLIVMFLAGLITWALARLFIAKVGGLTGDLYGAVCEIVELVALMAALSMRRWLV